MSIFRRILNLIFNRFRSFPFVLHEAYPEIVFWEVGQEVILKGVEKSLYDTSFDRITSAIVQDFDKNGKFVVKIKGQSYRYPYKIVISEQTYILKFLERVSPSTIRVEGVVQCNDSHQVRPDFFVSEIFNSQIRGKGGYMELLKSIREIVGMQDL